MMLLPLQGVPRRFTIPQGVALGYELLPLQGEALNTVLHFPLSRPFPLPCMVNKR